MSTPSVKYTLRVVEVQVCITNSGEQEFSYLRRKVMLFQCEYLLCSYFIRLNYPFGHLFLFIKKNTIAFLSNPLHLCHPWLYFTRLTFSYLYILLLMYNLPTTSASLPVKILPIIQISFQKLSCRIKVFPGSFIWPCSSTPSPPRQTKQLEVKAPAFELP